MFRVFRFVLGILITAPRPRLTVASDFRHPPRNLRLSGVRRSHLFQLRSVGTNCSTWASPRTNRCRAFLRGGAGHRLLQSGRAPGQRCARPESFRKRADICSARDGRERFADRVVGRKVSLQLLATSDRDSQRRFGQECQSPTRSHFSSARHDAPIPELSLESRHDRWRARAVLEHVFGHDGHSITLSSVKLPTVVLS